MASEPAHLHAVAEEVGPRGARADDSVASLDSRRSVASIGSIGSVGSIGSIGSVLSMGSIGSIASIGSAGSIASIGSAGSIASIGSIGSIASIGAAGAIGGQRARVRRASGARGLLGAWSAMTLTAAVIVFVQKGTSAWQ
jgi:hypothetical protein